VSPSSRISVELFSQCLYFPILPERLSSNHAASGIHSHFRKRITDTRSEGDKPMVTPRRKKAGRKSRQAVQDLKFRTKKHRWSQSFLASGGHGPLLPLFFAKKASIDLLHWLVVGFRPEFFWMAFIWFAQQGYFAGWLWRTLPPELGSCEIFGKQGGRRSRTSDPLRGSRDKCFQHERIEKLGGFSINFHGRSPRP